ncbi:inactive TPR repeat-containing thioredoxin TTL3-like [Durio zibethinus]|uniref:Inactive TPR repeat-containing thioredoxin TTL3-like n=1 Tax=Durio zibethinus TaxID=66656 RepID=A0A6P5YII5_DURZI|nr:inactive TPR repeat-containing thioredoxin TTL3-like [Durio zibethinus]
MGENSSEKKPGCGILNAVFGKRSFWPRRSTSTGSLPINDNNNVKTANSKRRRSGSDEASFFNSSVNGPEVPTKPCTKPPPNHPKPPVAHQQQNQFRKPPDQVARTTPNQGYVNPGRRVPKEAITISGELESMIVDHQKTKGNCNLVRASSSNMMLYGNLGNLRQPGGRGGNINSYNVLDQLPKTAREDVPTPNGIYPNSVMGNVVKKPVEERRTEEQPASLCRALSTRMDPETLKIMGNEDYKNGNFAEALALYEAAIAIDSNKAAYRSNKSAALAALGRILEAVFECREAIRIEPHYHRAHHRLANLYLRLGEVENAIYHYKHAGLEADREDIAKAKTLQAHLNKCTKAKRLRDWNTLVKETDSTINAGADSALQIYALKAEALLKLHRHQEADEALMKSPYFNTDDCTKYFGPIGNANLLVVRAQVDMAAGRFDDALAAIQRAVRLDSNNKEAHTVMRKARAVAAARSSGNEHFKASKFSEACVAYGEGLDHDPHNSVLLCNRAACLSKLGHYGKAIQDCTHALNVRPGYSKARLRRADCNSKLGKWEASIQDYEILQRETPDNEEVKQGLTEAQMQLKKQHSEVAL